MNEEPISDWLLPVPFVDEISIDLFSINSSKVNFKDSSSLSLLWPLQKLKSVPDQLINILKKVVPSRSSSLTRLVCELMSLASFSCLFRKRLSSICRWSMSHCRSFSSFRSETICIDSSICSLIPTSCSLSASTPAWLPTMRVWILSRHFSLFSRSSWENLFEKLN